MNKDAFDYLRAWFSSHLPHRCKNHNMYWEDEKGRGLFCGVCWNIIDEEIYPRY
jgi:hypothetical protein